MTKKHSIYAFKHIDVGYTVIKCDEEFNHEATYLVVRSHDDQNKWICSCPATVDCRHVKMRQMFEQKDRVNKPWWYDYDDGKWVKIRMPK